MKGETKMHFCAKKRRTDCSLVYRILLYLDYGRARARPVQCDGCVECACFPFLVSGYKCSFETLLMVIIQIYRY